MKHSLNLIISLFFLCLIIGTAAAQSSYFRHFEFTESDSLRGALRPERTCFDVLHYELTVEFLMDQKAIKGQNKMSFKLLESSDSIQLDLFDNMNISSIFCEGQKLDFHRRHNAFFIDAKDLEAGQEHEITIKYDGSPVIAKLPPWDGGFQWTTDEEGNPWVMVSCQGKGASLWWPNKDHLSDEPDSMTINLIVPQDFMGVSNGNLISVYEKGEKSVYSWKVSYPINNYNVTFSVGKYAQFSSTYESPLKGTLACDYYVMPYNLNKAKKHFKQVQGVLEAFEHFFGPYPFWNDGYALVETAHLGMEHQSAIAYGNKFQRGYMGGMIPDHMNWDYIIVHETGHEYFGNAVSTNDNAELWIHESFTTYMEALYVEYHLGYDEMVNYINNQPPIMNSSPIIGPKDVNFHKFSTTDMYYKGAWMLHTLRHTISNDDLFFSILRKFYELYKYKHARSEDFFELVNQETGKDYSAFFEQYLYHPDLPVLEYKIRKKGKKLILDYRWDAKVKDFAMSIRIDHNDKTTFIKPSEGKWKSISFKNTEESQIKIREDLILINTLKIREN